MLRVLCGSMPPPLFPHPPPLFGDDPRSQFRPAEPVIKIMKRPSAADRTSGQQQAEQGRPRQEQKTLKQREAEYAEARQRILGSDAGAGPGELPVAEGGPQLTPTKPVIKQKQRECKEGGGGGGGSARHPRGPDGSKGFSNKR